MPPPTVPPILVADWFMAGVTPKNKQSDAIRVEFIVLPCNAAGRIQQRRRRHQEADAAAQARVPCGLDRDAFSLFGTNEEIDKAAARRRLIAEADIALDAHDPLRRDLPVVAGIGIGPERGAIERPAG